MLNREKYAKEILDIACSGNAIAMAKGKLCSCMDATCINCYFYKPNRACHDAISEWANSEYVELPVDWSKVAVDTPILVKNKEDDFEERRYFASFDNGKVYAWNNGRTSWTEKGKAVWDYAKLAKSEAADARWIPVSERLPDVDEYILVSFENFTTPMIGRYTVDDEDSGTFRVGDEDESFVEVGLFVNAWIPLPKPYESTVMPDSPSKHFYNCCETCKYAKGYTGCDDFYCSVLKRMRRSVAYNCEHFVEEKHTVNEFGDEVNEWGDEL